MKWPDRKITAHVHKGDLGYIFHMKASSQEQARQIAIERTLRDKPEVMQQSGRLVIEFIFSG